MLLRVRLRRKGKADDGRSGQNRFLASTNRRNAATLRKRVLLAAPSRHLAFTFKPGMRTGQRAATDSKSDLVPDYKILHDTGYNVVACHCATIASAAHPTAELPPTGSPRAVTSSRCLLGGSNPGVAPQVLRSLSSRARDILYRDAVAPPPDLTIA